MKVNEALLKRVVEEVLAEVLAESSAGKGKPEELPSSGFVLTEIGPASAGKDPKEVVIGLPPAFGTVFDKTIVGIPLANILRQVMAGIEEEGMNFRLIRVHHTADVAFIAHLAAKMSGSGIGVGILSRGTTVIHQKDLAPLNNLELFPQSPLLDEDVFRAIGKNAAKYAKGESPIPVATRNDPMARPRYQGIAALLHNKEVKCLDRSRKPVEIRADFR
jgi:propanediol dehydratase medium subunit